MAAVSVRMLLAHQADGFAERGAVAELRPDAVDARRPADRGQHALGWTDLRRGRPVGGDRGRAGSHARPREPSIVDQLADADPRWADRGALAAGVVTGPRPAAIAPKGVFGDGDLQDASARVWGRARPAVQSLPHRAARRIGRLAPVSGAHTAGRGPRHRRCCMNTLWGWGGLARTSRDPPQDPHYRDEVEGSSHV